jgi:hypothetical protein
MLGNNHWLGSPAECLYVNEMFKLSLSDRFERIMKPDLLTSLSPFQVEFRVVHAKHNSPWQIEMKVLSENVLHVGLCLPKSCSNNEIFDLAQTYFDNQTNETNIFEMDVKLLQVKDLNLRENFFKKKSVILLW